VSDQTDVGVIAEPVGRNTAAAIALAATSIERDPDEVMVVLPADHLIARDGHFRAVLAEAARELAEGAFGIESPLVTLGIEAIAPATQYGYLVPDRAREQGPPAFKLHAHVLDAFVEKPDEVRARQLRDKAAAWNAGIFLARRRAWLAALQRHTSLVRPLSDARDSESRLEAAYQGFESISIDYAVMQPAAAEGQVVMGAMNVGWSDVGTWTALLDALAGSYAGVARVVPPTEHAALAGDDLAVLRSTDDVLRLEGGPATLVSEGPLALLPDARRYRAVLEALIARVNHAMSATAKVNS
jgi:mannose-1-phosphate guanylyltransferase